MYTMRGAYRKSKMVIDYLHLILTAVIVILFLMIVFLRSRSGYLFPAVFLVGAVDNAIAAAKDFMNEKRLPAWILVVVTAFLVFMAIASWQIVAA